jgi:hypothetical protein
MNLFRLFLEILFNIREEMARASALVFQNNSDKSFEPAHKEFLLRLWYSFKDPLKTGRVF